MGIKKEKIEGKLIINEIESTNMEKTIYDTGEKTMTVVFKNGTSYIYEQVPHQVYTKFRKAESQGKYFYSEISRKYKYRKLTK